MKKLFIFFSLLVILINSSGLSLIQVGFNKMNNELLSFNKIAVIDNINQELSVSVKTSNNKQKRTCGILNEVLNLKWEDAKLIKYVKVTNLFSHKLSNNINISNTELILELENFEPNKIIFFRKNTIEENNQISMVKVLVIFLPLANNRIFTEVIYLIKVLAANLNSTEECVTSCFVKQMIFYKEIV